MARRSFLRLAVDRTTLAIPRPNFKRAAYGCTTGISAGGLNQVGDVAATAGAAAAGIAPSANDPSLFEIQSGTASGNDATIEGELNYRTGRNIFFQSYAQISRTADIRAAIGVTNQTAATQVGADDPAGHYAYFRYSTPAGDTNWQCITKDGSTQEITDSGIAASASGFEFEIRFDDTANNVEFYIDGTLEATHSTNIPVSGNNCRWVDGVETQTTARKDIRMGWYYVESDL